MSLNEARSPKLNVAGKLRVASCSRYKETGFGQGWEFTAYGFASEVALVF